jgi:hypothetical protein
MVEQLSPEGFCVTCLLLLNFSEVSDYIKSFVQTSKDTSKDAFKREFKSDIGRDPTPKETLKFMMTLGAGKESLNSYS